MLSNSSWQLYTFILYIYHTCLLGHNRSNACRLPDWSDGRLLLVGRHRACCTPRGSRWCAWWARFFPSRRLSSSAVTTAAGSWLATLSGACSRLRMKEMPHAHMLSNSAMIFACCGHRIMRAWFCCYRCCFMCVIWYVCVLLYVHILIVNCTEFYDCFFVLLKYSTNYHELLVIFMEYCAINLL